MSTGVSLPGSAPLAIATAHGRLHGTLALPGQPVALVLLAHCSPAPGARHDALAAALHHRQVGTLTLDLLTSREERFADLHHDVSLLCRRLLDGLALLKQRMLLGELPTLPIGLFGAGDCSPVVLRVAALRDDDIFALVCHGGLIDLAGLIYLRTLAAPLLVLVGDEEPGIETSNRRALAQVSCVQELKVLPTRVDAHDSEPPAALLDNENAPSLIAVEAVRWFARHLPQTLRS